MVLGEPGVVETKLVRQLDLPDDLIVSLFGRGIAGGFDVVG
jgi:hypothetical protein